MAVCICQNFGFEISNSLLENIKNNSKRLQDTQCYGRCSTLFIVTVLRGKIQVVITQDNLRDQTKPAKETKNRGVTRQFVYV